MKKIVLIIMAVIGFAGMSVAQDIYGSGYYTNSSGRKVAAVYKNGVKLYNSDPGNEYYHDSPDVYYYNGDVYWVINSMHSDGSYNVANIGKNNSITFLQYTGGQPHIYALHGTNDVFFAVGCKNSSSNVKTAWYWRSDQGTGSSGYQKGNGDYESEAFDATYHTQGNTNTLRCCGYQYTNASTYHGVIWGSGTTEFATLPNGTKLYGITCYDGWFYTVGSAVESGSTKLKVWRVDASSGAVSEVYTLSTSMSSSYVDSRFSICVDAGDIYVNGMDGSTEKVWKNGNVLYTPTSSFLYSVVANSNGVYYAGDYLNSGKIWKDNSVLYTLSDCTTITNLFIGNPTCTVSEPLSLPFTENFENGSTSWSCWTTLDVDNNNGGTHFRPFWDRRGNNNSPTPYAGDYCACHGWGVNAQEGWLISPHLFLQPGRDETTLTFKSNEIGSSYADYRGVWISTSGTSTSNFTEVWSQNSPQNNVWHDVSIDLSDYQGQAIYIAFKYTGTDGIGWMIDNVSVTEDWSSCGNYNVPYTMDFSNGDEPGYCWYIWDDDMSGGGYHWKYNSSEQCAYHPWGPSGVYQYGCLVSPNINLVAGHDYVLKFRHKSSSSGSNMSNKIYYKLDGTGTPNPDTYTSQLWSDSNYPSAWTEVEIPLSSYAGHTISFSFEYTGTWAHAWYIDDVRVEEAIAQYTITANANNNAWGTVTGGGTYNAGETCTLTATPASGYQFESWKKNGSVVSTNPNYSFTVTENATYTAYFAEVPVTYYTITTNVTPSGSGTVTGGGTYPEGASVTLTANANNGYTFSQWQDGNTQNPRTVTVTGNATYTATFSQDTYIITTAANPTNGGTVTGGGAYHYGDTPTLTATANSGYEFAGWQDGSTTNPRQITVTGNATYTATFSEVGSVYYTVTATVDPTDAGTVTGTGTYEEGSVIMLTAVANPGYTFDHWNDGSTINPRSVTVNGNMNFTAYFNRNQYTITVNANPSNAGTVNGGGAYYYGDYATLTASAFSGYEFVGWSDGSSENPHQVLVTSNATYTATFSEVGATYYTVSAYVSPAGAGTVSGTGTYPAGASVTLTATANSGYTFDHWNDGSTTNPRTITVNNNMSFTAYFNTQEYTITTNVTPAGSGTVTGGGTYPYGATATLTATPNSGYEFLQWSDGSLQNPRVITVTGNATYTALFSNGSGEMYTLTVRSNSVFLGEAYGSGTYPAGSSVEISAYPTAYAHFVKWDDGNTENPRTVVVNSDMEFVAEFAATQNYTITVESADPERGQAFGSGTYREGTEVQIAAVAFGGYMFEKWQDGNTQNPRTIIVNGDATYTAHFVENSVVTYTITLISNTNEGSVSGGGTYLAGATATIQAFPNPGYVFSKWSDDNTDNPRTITVNSDLTLAAFFATGVGENELANLQVYPNPAKESIRILGIEANSQVEIYNSLGELVKAMSVNPDQEIGIRDLASGLYLVRCGNVMLRFVKEQ
ncbi:MAG: choice-of-anchor J domain-containing protein [Bacteroidales bacterium]|nr:choice-of-anchor J domain-containing protein [Bacteroidales bacterium]